MILIDAHNISNGGGLVLINLLLSQLESESISYFLIHNGSIKSDGIKDRSALCVGIYKRAQVLTEVINSISPQTLLCFGNLPPSIKYNCRVITYFHHPYLILPLWKLLTTDWKMIFRELYLRKFITNTNSFVFQNEFMKANFIRKYGLYPRCNYEIFPFYDENYIKKFQNVGAKLKQFIYPSLPHKHKNHHFLLEVWRQLSNKGINPHLLLTIPKTSENRGILLEIDNINISGGNILNLGYIKYDEMLEQISNSEFVIYPSNMETLGLGLLEASILKSKLITPNLEYVHQVVDPSIFFDPDDVTSCCNVILKVLNGNPDIPFPKNRIKNGLSEFIEYLKANQV